MENWVDSIVDKVEELSQKEEQNDKWWQKTKYPSSGQDKEVQSEKLSVL